jgi:hypothetical protein
MISRFVGRWVIRGAVGAGAVGVAALQFGECV